MTHLTNLVEFPALGLSFPLNRVAFSIGGINIYWYGVCIAVGMCLALVFAFRRCTEFGIGASAAEVVRAIFYNENRVLSVSVLLDGQYGQHDVYASVPAIVGRDGIAHIIELHLTPEEQEKFNASCKTMSENYQLSLTL